MVKIDSKWTLVLAFVCRMPSCKNSLRRRSFSCKQKSEKWYFASWTKLFLAHILLKTPTYEQGVSRSLTILLGSLGEGPVTCLKWVACWTFRTGSMRASRTAMPISAPEYRSVSWPSFVKSASVRQWQPSVPRWSLKRAVLAGASGRGM